MAELTTAAVIVAGIAIGWAGIALLAICKHFGKEDR